MKWKLLLVVAGAAILAIAGMRVALNSAPSDINVAIASARHSLTRFRSRLEHPLSDDKSFFIRARFGGGKAIEYLWVKQVKPTPGGFMGVVDEEATAGSGAYKGENVAVKEPDVVDWAILKANGRTEGGFTQGLEP